MAGHFSDNNKRHNSSVSFSFSFSYSVNGCDCPTRRCEPWRLLMIMMTVCRRLWLRCFGSARCRTLGALVKVLIWHIIVAVVAHRALVRYGYGYEHMVLCEHNYYSKKEIMHSTANKKKEEEKNSKRDLAMAKTNNT